VRRWLEQLGREPDPASDLLLITTDGGGSNGSRVRLWKLEPLKLADETGLTIAVCHYPPKTSKWNKIEHRLFCEIAKLARTAIDEPLGDRRADPRDDDKDWLDGELRTR
jgi:hypothetical protein